MQLKIEEYESKLDEIKSYVGPKESEEMTWEKFMINDNEALLVEKEEQRKKDL